MPGTPRPPARSGRLLASLAVASLSGWVAGILHHGLLLGPAPPRLILTVAALGGVMGALLRGSFPYARAAYVLPFAIYCATLTFTTSSYLRERGRIWNVELLLPSAVAMVPFSIAHRAVGRHLEPMERRRRRGETDE